MGYAPKKRKVGTTGSASGQSNENIKIFNPKKPVEVVRPDWDAKSIPTCVHLTGAIQQFDPYTGERVEKTRLPFREGPERGDINNFYLQYPVVSVGTTKTMFIQFILADLPEDGIWRNNSGDKTFYGTIINECCRAYYKRHKQETANFRAKVGKHVFDPADWADLLPVKNSDYRTRLFSGAGVSQLTGIFPCLNLVSGEYLRLNEDGTLGGAGRGDIPRMLVASSSATKAIRDLIFQPAEGYDAQSEDPDSWMYGDPTNPDGSGKWLVLYNESLEGNYSQALGMTGAIDIAEGGDGIMEGGGTSSGKTDIAKRYKAQFLEKFVGPANKNEGRARWTVSQQLDQQAADNALDNYDELDSYLYIGDEEEQAWWIYQALAQAPRGMHILQYGTRDIPHFWTDEIKAHMKNRKNVPMMTDVQDVEGEEDQENEAAADIESLLDDSGSIEEGGGKSNPALASAGLDLDDPEVFDEDDDAIAELEELAAAAAPKKKQAKKKVIKKKAIKKKLVKKVPTKKKAADDSPAKKKLAKKSPAKKKKTKKKA